MKRTYLNFITLFRTLAISLLIAVIFLSFSAKTFAATGINRVINFQGKVVNKTTGLNVANGTYNFVFSIYDKTSSGTQLWTENQNSIQVTDGIFRVGLGSSTAFPTDFNFNWDGLYLDITFNGETMGSRLQLTAVPFAFNSQKVAGLTVLDSAGAVASTSATLKIGTSADNPITVDLGLNNITLNSGAYNGSTSLTLNTTNGVATTLTLPTSGTVTALGNTTTGMGSTLVLNSNPSFAGITLSSGAINLGATNGTSDDCLKGGTTAAWGSCGGGGTNYWNLVSGNGVSNGGYITPINSTADFLLGATSTTSALFSVTGLTGADVNVNIVGSATIGNNPGDDVSKKTTSDFTQGTKCSGTNYCVTTNDGVDTVSTSNDSLKLVTDVTAGSYTASNAGPSTGTNIAIAMPSLSPATTSAMQRPNGTFLVVAASTNLTKIYDPVQNVFTAGPPMTANADNGILMFQRPDGSAVILHGGKTVYTSSIYYPWNALGGGGQMKAGPTLPAGHGPGPGSQVIRMSNGRFLIIIGGGGTATAVYDSTAGTTDIGSFTAGPKLTSTVGPGSFVFEKPDGKWVVGLGCQNVACSSSSTTNIYDPSTNGFSVGPSLTAGSGLGAHVIQRPDGNFLVILGKGTQTTNTYDLNANTFANSGATTTANVGQGAHSFQRADGKWITVLGGNSNVVNLYDPSANSFSDPSTNLQGAAGPGALAFQRSDGQYIVVGGNGTQTTTLYDGGWNTTGTWTSEDINSTKISTYSAILWDANLQSQNNTTRFDKGAMSVAIKTGRTQAELAINPYLTFSNSGSLLQAVGQAAWAKIQVTFNTPVRSYPQATTSQIAQTNMWTGEGSTFLRRSFIQPTLFSVKIQNPLVSYGGVTSDPQFGRNFATAGATLEGVVTNNNNQLSLAINRNLPVATPSAGFIIATASANLGGSAAAGANAINLPNGDVLVLLGGNGTATRIYDPDTNNFSTGPTLPNGCGNGCHSFQMPNGQYFVVLANNTKNTAIYDPPTNVFYTGPNLANAANTGAGSFQRPDGLFIIISGTTLTTNILDSFTMSMSQGPSLTAAAGAGTIILRRPDGRITVMLGGTVTGNTYDAALNAFTAGPNLTTGTLVVGSTAVQLASGRYIIKTSTTVSQTLDPITNTFTPGPAYPTVQAAGAFDIPRPDGKIMFAQGGSTSTSIYDPDTGATNVTGTFATFATSPTLPCTPGAGAFVFQRPDGAYVLICGGGNATTTAIIDAGWNIGGTYTTEQLYMPNMSSSTSLYWQNVGKGDITVKYRTASTQAALGLASWKDMNNSGNLINSTSGDVWFQAKFDFSGDIPDMPGAKSNVWPSADTSSVTVYYRTVNAPIMSYWKLLNTPRPNVLTLTTGGSNIFRFTADGQAFTSDGGAWNSGGADLAERYSSKQTLSEGEVVVGDRLYATNVEKSTIPYQTNIMGVVSTKPGFVAGSYTPDSYPIALVGRVPVKASSENGVIKSGDALTSGSIPGYAMKATVAGRILGYAIEDFDPASAEYCPKTGAGSLDSTTCGSLIAFINLTNYGGQDVELAMNDKGVPVIDGTIPIDPDSIQIMSENGMTVTSFSKDQQILNFLRNANKTQTFGSEIFTDRVSATGEVISPKIITDLLIAKKIRADSIEGLEFLIANSKLVKNQELKDQNSTESASLSLEDKIASIQMQILAASTQSAALAPQALNFDSDAVATTSGDFRVKGNGLVEGILNVIDTITTNNFIANGLSTFFGNSVFKGDIEFQGVAVFNTDAAGSATVKKGEKKIEVKFEKEYKEIPIIQASTVLPDITDELYKQYVEQGICEKEDSQEDCQSKVQEQVFSANQFLITKKSVKGFTIVLQKEAAIDRDFSWIAISVKPKLSLGQ